MRDLLPAGYCPVRGRVFPQNSHAAGTLSHAGRSATAHAGARKKRPSESLCPPPASADQHAQERSSQGPLGKCPFGFTAAHRAVVQVRQSRHILLSDATLEVLRTMPRTSGNPWLFLGHAPGKPLSDLFLFWSKLRRELGFADM